MSVNEKWQVNIQYKLGYHNLIVIRVYKGRSGGNRRRRPLPVCGIVLADYNKYYSCNQIASVPIHEMRYCRESERKTCLK